MDENTKLTLAAATALASVVGALIGGGSVMLKDYLQARWSRHTDRERWLRDKLHEVYSNCIFYMNHVTFTSLAYDGTERAKTLEFDKVRLQYDKLNTELWSEQRRWLNMLIVYHPQRGTVAFDDFTTKLRTSQINVQYVIDLAAADPRLKGNS